MKKFVTKVLLLLGLVILMWAIIITLDFWVVGNQYLNNYQASILDKTNRAESIGSKKILLIGNSNVSFGFDSELLEKELALPVVNMGIHSGLSNAFQEDMAKPYISEGDIVLLCHNSFNDGYIIRDPSLAWITIEKHMELWPIIRECNKIDMLKAYPLYALNCLMLSISGKGNKVEDSCYSRQAFNEYGDVIYRPDFEKRPASTIFYNGAIKVPSVTEDTVERINDFNDFCLSRGALLLVVGYPIAYGEYTPSKEEYIEFQNMLSGYLQCPVISDYTDYFIPYDYFYNTIYHLTEEGTKIRTIQTVKDVKRYLSMSEQ